MEEAGTATGTRVGRDRPDGRRAAHGSGESTRSRRRWRPSWRHPNTSDRRVPGRRPGHDWAAGTRFLVARGTVGRLSRRVVAVTRAVRGWSRAAAEEIQCRWRRSLLLRVVTTTLGLSALVIAVLGFFLTQQIADGLVANKVKSATAQVSAGLTMAESDPALTRAPSSAAAADRFLYPTAQQLQDASGNDNSYHVVIEVTPTRGDSPVYIRGVTSGVNPAASIPATLSASVASEQAHRRTGTIYYAPTTLVPTHGGAPQPGLAVGAPLGSYYQLYYLFPLTQEQQTLQLVQRTIAGAGLALIVLLALIASLVTRWVVIPVRHAAQAAQRLSAGRLDERMQVHGIDDLAALATSFNEMAASLHDKLRELEELSKVQRQFVSDVSHELRTPLATIRMAADVLLGAKDRLDASAARSAELLQAQVERFQVLLEDLLEISRHDAGAATLDIESVDMCDLVRHSADDAWQLAERRGCRIEFRLPAEPCMAEVDRRRVERILRNLLVNAVEHGEGKDVVVTVGADRDAVAVAVRDHGIGLAPGQEQLVFDRFWRADPARARTSGGTGLGLAIALEDARLHGGWLQAWGQRGNGSVFRLTLPRTAGDQLAGSPLPLVPDDVDVLGGGPHSAASVRAAYPRTGPSSPQPAGVPAGDPMPTDVRGGANLLSPADGGGEARR